MADVRKVVSNYTKITGAFDSIKIKAWSTIQDLIMEAIEKTNALAFGPDAKEGKKVNELLQAAQKECVKQLKS